VGFTAALSTEHPVYHQVKLCDISGLHSCAVNRTPCISSGETVWYKWALQLRYQQNTLYIVRWNCYVIKTVRFAVSTGSVNFRKGTTCRLHDQCSVLYSNIKKMVSTNAHNIYIVHSVHFP